MRIGFYLQDAEKYGEMAESLIRSAKKTMPDVEVWQFSDEGAPQVADLIKRIPGDIPMGTRRVMHYQQCDGDWAFVDADILFLKDVQHVFGQSFDVAMASREGTYLEGSDYEKVMPYNFGVVFSRSPAFWGRCLQIMRRLDWKHQEWGAEQCVACQVLDAFPHMILPAKYNYTPETRLDELRDVHILHLKGKRKTWFPELAS